MSVQRTDIQPLSRSVLQWGLVSRVFSFVRLNDEVEQLATSGLAIPQDAIASLL